MRHCAPAATVVALLLASTFAPSAMATLFGGVTHSDSVPAADTVYPPAKLLREPVPTAQPAPGNAPPQSAAIVPTQTIEWMQLPRWMAGKWTKRGDMTVSYTDLRTGVTTPMNEWTDNEMTVTWGQQYDAQGNIWQANFLPLVRESTSNGKLVKFTIVSLKADSPAPNQVVSRAHSIITESVGTQIVDIFQQESLNDYVLLPNGELENRSSNRDYTYEGQPIKGGELVSRHTKVAAFVPEATRNGIDMLQSLNDYLKSHGMSQLVRTSP